MRVVGGEFRGRRLKTCEGPGYRPATHKVREAVFSMLQARGVSWHQARVVDMFAGSGSLGVECLSRGAEFALFVEKSKKAAALIRGNLKDLGVPSDHWSVLPKDLFAVLGKKPDRPFDMAFIDPPYGKDLLVPALEAALENEWFAPDAFILAEVEAAVRPPEQGPLAQLELITDREYGQTRILLWRR
ncbi:16S rRNA (guanine(966)-N(2))-methyltransferase RsmD [Pseudodesulfovibrio senegalensis]|uniref:16S rRNA (Guanine(966)-N(2))-methyltransferase RsmD n=1 Tax=Pseudodesulfovibrio senegalensis TaxID=1721087 RepID=A0A6N6N0F5_9BACT|nr:16S rRNA (guanine(966)-N(2))-methyltransferase RsmD [Pseudodesulfovibrio senegalensis]KAB1441187.1 16S rRNA (guanine(966)-N(2))-methyltransferase RsmD [Pseudodesulfovibrio senegalensis]